MYARLMRAEYCDILLYEMCQFLVILFGLFFFFFFFFFFFNSTHVYQLIPSPSSSSPKPNRNAESADTTIDPVDEPV